MRQFFQTIFLCVLIINTVVKGQNFQLHYDFASDRQYFTSTLEMFRPDDKGATFWFVDFDYNQPGNKSASLGYWEFARYFKLPFKEGLSATLQFNDGVAPWGPLGHIWLAGASLPVNLRFTTISTEFLYRSAYGSSAHDGQLTFVYFLPLFDGKAHITGFADIWSQDKRGEKGKEVVVMSQPQLWYSVAPKLYIGGEARISQNVLPKKGWQIYITVGAKWDMDYK